MCIHAQKWWVHVHVKHTMAETVWEHPAYTFSCIYRRAMKADWLICLQTFLATAHEDTVTCLFTAWTPPRPGSLTFWNSCLAPNKQPLCTMALITVNQWQADSSIIAVDCGFYGAITVFALDDRQIRLAGLTKMDWGPNLCSQQQ